MPPSRLNARVPRDLETICLKCLSKEPQARYASAAALAEDLRRFRLGEAIAARPPGRAERLARWVRRRRAQAAVVTVGTLMAAGLIGGGLRLWSEERAIERGVEDDLQEAARREQEADWSGAAIALERARGRLSRGGPAGLRQRLDQAGRDLDQACGERLLAARVDAIRLARMTLVEGRYNHGADRRFNDARADRVYETAFREAHVGTPADDPGGVGARVAASAATAPPSCAGAPGASGRFLGRLGPGPGVAGGRGRRSRGRSVPAGAGPPGRLGRPLQQPRPHPARQARLARGLRPLREGPGDRPRLRPGPQQPGPGPER